MGAESTQRPRLKNLDDLFLLNDGIDPTVQSNNRLESSNNRLQSTIAIASLTPFRGHPFRLYEGERLEDMVDSIKKNGILVPIIVRRIGEEFEILSGHNRVHAAGLAGLERVPIIALENVSDEEAWIYVVETNLMQRSFSDMAHSEKAAVIAVQHSKLFSQGKRNDILEELRILEKPYVDKENGTYAQFEHRLKAREIVAKEYGLDRNTVARYLRIHKLTDQLKARLDNGEIPFIPAVTISFLKDTEQILLDKCIGLNGLRVDMKKADLLRKYAESDRLDEDNIYLILSGELHGPGKKRNSYSFKLKPQVYKKFFTNQHRPKEVETIVEKALSEYFERHKTDAT